MCVWMTQHVGGHDMKYASAFFITLAALFLCATTAQAAVHSADTSENGRISLNELLRVAQFFNSDGYSCASGTEDGYAPGLGASDCTPHDSDYHPQDWQINLTELLRAVQLFTFGRYQTEIYGEDGFAPCTDTDLDPHLLPVLGDEDGSFMTPAEKDALGLPQGVADADGNGVPDGVDIGRWVAEAIEGLEMYFYVGWPDHEYAPADPPKDGPFLVLFGEAECGCLDPFDGGMIYLSPYEIANLELDLHIPLQEVALKFLSYGSFTYFASTCEVEFECVFDHDQQRVDVVALLTALGYGEQP
jgi:hypothetical protein